MELGPLGMVPWGMVNPTDRADAAVSRFRRDCRGVGQNEVPPDFQADQDLRYIHKRDGNADIYFVANGQPTAVEAGCTFRVSGKPPEIWDAVTGEMRPAMAFQQAENARPCP